MLTNISKLIILYLFASKFTPPLLMEFCIKIIEQLCIQEIDKAVSNITVILDYKRMYLDVAWQI